MFGNRKEKEAEEQEVLIEKITEDVIDKIEANEVIVDRKGIFTPEQEKLLDELYEAKGIIESVDGVAIRMFDNIIIERLKAKIPAEYLPTVYEIIDEVMKALTPPKE